MNYQEGTFDLAVGIPTLKNQLTSIERQRRLKALKFWGLVVCTFVALAMISSHSMDLSESLTNSISYLTSTPLRQKRFVFVGSYTKEVDSIVVDCAMDGRGITVFELDPTTGNLQFTGNTVESGENPSILTVGREKSLLFAANELGSQDKGKLFSFLIDSDSGGLVALDDIELPGYNPSSINISPDEKYLATSYFLGDGGFSIHSVQPDGSFGALTAHATWEAGSRCHTAAFTPGGAAFVLALDWALDLVLSFALDPATGAATEVDRAALAAGAGPRSLAWGAGAGAGAAAAAGARAAAAGGAPAVHTAYVSLQGAGGVQRVLVDARTGRLSVQERVLYAAATCSGVSDIAYEGGSLFVDCRYGDQAGQAEGVIKVHRLGEDGSIMATAAPATVLSGGSSTRNIITVPLGTPSMAISTEDDIVATDDGEGLLLLMANEASGDLTYHVFSQGAGQALRGGGLKEPRGRLSLPSPEGIVIL